MAVEEFDTGFGRGRRTIGTNEAALAFDPPVGEQYAALFAERNRRNQELGSRLLDWLDEENAQPERERTDFITRLADETGESLQNVFGVWVWLNARKDVVLGPDGGAVTARSLRPPQEGL
ncbi:MAG TPA: hypothetical protein VLF40_00965 [Candidatus Saccharimonadales bacterium]|nr:hypothetical protein [Candidatus Saccharimonadales bacterium]